MENQNLKPKPNNSWTTSELEGLTKTLTVLINGQKAYGKDYSVRDTLNYFRMKLERRFSVNQVIYALDLYTDRKNDIPNPADIINILDPEEPRITEAQYIRALDYQKRNNYPMFSEAKTLIEKYEEQENEKRGVNKIECEKIASLVSDSVRRLT